MKFHLRVLLFLFALLPFSIYSAPGLSLFSPTGEVKDIQQVKVIFSEPVVAFGDPSANTDIFQISCSAKGKARWADERTYLYEFESKLGSGHECTFTLKDFPTASGHTIRGGKKYSFSTGGPQVLYTSPYIGSDVSEDQIFLLQVDGPVDMPSLENHINFIVEGIASPIDTQILSPEDIPEIIKANYGKNIPENLVIVKANRTFPSGKKVSLIWQSGIRSVSGVSSTSRQVLNYKTRDDFTASIHCSYASKKGDCIPLLPITLSFSSPISIEDALKIKFQTGSKIWKSDLDLKAEKPTSVTEINFSGPFPEETNFTLSIPASIKDDAGRILKNSSDFPRSVKISSFPPLAKFSAKFGILELNANPVLPVTVRNIEEKVKLRLLQLNPLNSKSFGPLEGKKVGVKPENIVFWLQKLYSSKISRSVFKDIKQGKKFLLPRKNGINAFEVVGIPLKKPGFYVLELTSPALGVHVNKTGKSAYVATSALVTNMAVHLKKGTENSLVWVTSLDKGEGIAGATVEVRNCENKVLIQARTNEEGIAIFSSKNIKEPKYCSYKNYANGLLVSASKGNDFSFVHSSWEDGIENWRFNLSSGEIDNKEIYHSILDRSLLRAGEELHIKNLVRLHTGKGMRYPKLDTVPELMEIEHIGSGQKFRFSLKWETNRTADASWKIPKDAKLGEYQIYLMYPKDKNNSYERKYSTESFRVEEFRIPLMKADVKVPTEKIVSKTNFPVNLSISYLSGGGAGNLPVKFKYFVKDDYYTSFPDYADFSFDSEKIIPGRFRTDRAENEDELKIEKIQQIKLDETGGKTITISGLPTKDTPYNVLTELEFADPNGEIQTVSKRIPVYPTEYVIGIKQDSWIASKDKLKIISLVLDLRGKPVRGQKVNVDMYSRKYFSHRKRLVGGFYSYESYREIKKLGEFCSGQTDEKGMLICEGKTTEEGNILFSANTISSSGKEARSNTEIWIESPNSWYAGSDHDRADLIPVRKKYETGEEAEFQFRIPFSEARVLVTVEREGILDSYIQNVKGRNPSIRIPIKNNYSPNVFVSAMAVRGRVGGIRPTALIDLGKPSYKLGIAEIKVGWKPHELEVKVEPDKEVYGVREKANIRVKVSPLIQSKLPKNTELIVAVVDEGLLELKNNTSWNVLEKMMGTRGNTVQTSTAQMQVVGRRHFGLKAIKQGGGGGTQNTRELFDTLLYWKTGIKPNPSGEAEFSFITNDSLTSFRVVVMAIGGSSLYGKGHTKIRSTRDLMLFSGIPPIIREGDIFPATFTLRNAGKEPLSGNISIQLQDAFKGLQQDKFSLQAGEAKEFSWKIKIPRGKEKASYLVTAKSENGKTDTIRVSQKILPYLKPTVRQASIVQLENTYNLPVEKPEGAEEGKGGLRIIYSRSLLRSLSGVKEYMRDYPYSCFEQEVSKAISLRSKDHWERIMAKAPAYLDSEGFIKYFPSLSFGSPILTSYVLSIAKEAAYPIPPEVFSRMTYALQGFITGSIHRNSVLSTPDLSIRKIAAIEALSRYGLAKKEYLEPLDVIHNLLPTSALIDLWNIYNRLQVTHKPMLMDKVETILRARLDMQGTVMSFSTAKTDNLYWLMVSSDVNATRLLLSLLEMNTWKRDIPRLVRGIVSRQKRGAWDLTVANAWGVLALEKFAAKFEKEKVTGYSITSYAGKNKKMPWSKVRSAARHDFPWSSSKMNLTIKHDGKGKPWVNIQSRAAIALKKPFSAGYSITKQLIPVEVKNKGKYSKGDVWKIRLIIKANSAKAWVVLNDPIPSGSTILGSGLGRDSESLSSDNNKSWSLYSAFTERRMDAYREYFTYVPEGTHNIEYTVRLNQDGKFMLPPSRIEAMYFPEMFGEFPNGEFNIE